MKRPGYKAPAPVRMDFSIYAIAEPPRFEKTSDGNLTLMIPFRWAGSHGTPNPPSEQDTVLDCGNGIWLHWDEDGDLALTHSDEAMDRYEAGQQELREHYARKSEETKARKAAWAEKQAAKAERKAAEEAGQ